VGVLPLGGLCFALIAFLLYYKTGQTFQLFLGPAMFAAGVWRYFKIMSVDHAEIHDAESALVWERRYLWWGSLHGLIVGSFGFATIVLGEDSFA
ncbi:hypothetical protein, partial [Klebsiella pneumoniae]